MVEFYIKLQALVNKLELQKQREEQKECALVFPLTNVDFSLMADHIEDSGGPCLVTLRWNFGVVSRDAVILSQSSGPTRL